MPVAALSVCPIRELNIPAGFPKASFVITGKPVRRVHAGTLQLGHWIKEYLKVAGLTQDNSMLISLGVLVHHKHIQRDFLLTTF